MRNLVLTAWIGTFAWLSISCAKADLIFRYEPNSPVALSASVDVRNPTEAKRSCVEFQSAEWVEAGSATESNLGGVTQILVTAEYTDSYKEIIEKLNINAGYKASAAFKKVGLTSDAKVTMGDDFQGKYADLSYVLTAQYEFGQRRIVNPTLKPEFQKLIDDGKTNEFISKCGTHFAISETRWSYAAIVINVSNLNETTKKRITGNYKGSAKFMSAANLNVELGIDHQYDVVTRYGHATMQFAANGGDPVKAASLAGAVQTNDLAAALSAMQQYMSGIDRNTAAPSSYRMVPFSLFGLDAPESLEQTDFLSDIYLASVRYESDIAKLEDRIDSLERSALADFDLVKIYKLDLQRLQTLKATLDALGRACILEDKCNRQELTSQLPELIWSSSTLMAAAIEPVCLYNDNALDSLSVRMSGKVLDPLAVQDIIIFRLDEAQPDKWTEIHPSRTRFNDDGRFVARVDLLEAQRSETGTLDTQEMLDRARRTRYELQLVLQGEAREWYDLGTLSVNGDVCPALR